MKTETIDYTAMDAGKLLEALGDDASKWGAAFMQHVAKNVDDLCEDTMRGWFANAIETAHDKRTNAKLSPSEAIFGFVAWLTTRPGDLLIGASHNASPLPDLIRQFIDVNGLDEPREAWTKNLTHPTD